MKGISSLLLIVTIGCLLSCSKVRGVGPMVTETISTGSFNGINLEIPAKLYYTPSPSTEQKIEIKAQRNILEIIETHNSQGELRFKLKNNTALSNREDIEVHIHAPDVLRLKINGSGEINVLKDFNPGSLLVRTHGSGTVSIGKLETILMNAELNGSGKVSVLSGSVQTAGVEISGSGRIDMQDVQADSASCKISGSGNVKLQASDYLHVTISGSGSVMYKGTPVVESHISGSGKVIRL